MKRIKFFGAVLFAAYCVFFGAFVVFGDTTPEAKWYLGSLCAAATLFCSWFAYEARPSQWCY